MIAEENRPLARVRNWRRLPNDVADWKAILARNGHIHARHQREVKRHVAFVAIAKIHLHVFRPLVYLSEQHAVGKVRVEFGTNSLYNLVCLWQVFVASAFALD